MAPNARPPSHAFLVSLAVLFALLHAIMAVTATAKKSITADEIAHFTGGHSYNTRGDFRLQPENGNLPQRLVALPLLVAGKPLPSMTVPPWQVADVWNYGHIFFYEQALATDQFVFLGRALVALVSAATALLVFFWSRALFGGRGAFLSLALFVFCPAFLAHGALATSDVVMTFFFLASVGAWWSHLERPGFGRAALSAVTLGLAFVAKFSAVLLPPMLGLAALVWAADRARIAGWRPVLARLLRTTALHGIVTWIIIWAFYGFRYSAFAPGLGEGAGFNWGWIVIDLGWASKIILPLKEHHILPEAWLYGFTFVLQFSHARGAFLNGHYSLTGWPQFFPYAFLVKSTVPFLLLSGAVAVGGARIAVRRMRGKGLAGLAPLRALTPLAALFAVYWVTSLTSHLNIGHRHILPTYPVLFICAGWLGRWLDFRRPLAAGLILSLLAWHAGESLWIRPDYLAYFNQFAGGPANGWRHLVDSSLDWGQDLPGTAEWLERNNPPPARAPVFLAYFGTAEPTYEGIVATRLPSLPDFGRTYPHRPLTAGIYCVSATLLQQVYSSEHEWSLATEREFQQLLALEPRLLQFANDPKERSRLLQDMPAERWAQLWKRYDQLRFARLCPYLQLRDADAEVGYSILIYRLSDEEITAATKGSLADWHALIERAAAHSPH